MFKKRFAVISILALVIIIHFIFAFQRIKNFSGGDETLWSYSRVPDFWNAVAAGKWKKTDVSDKPGITLVLLSGAGLPFSPDPKAYGDLMYSSKTPSELKAIENIYFYLRLPILLFSLLSILLYFFFIKKLLGTKIALISAVFIGLSPILVGMSIYINSDSLLWIFMPLTILSFLIYQKENSRKYIILSGVFLGLSLLTKYVAAILFPFLFVLIFFEYIFSLNNPPDYFKKALTNYLILLAISTAVIFLLYPVIWVKPQFILESTLLSRPFLKIWPIFLILVLAFISDTIIFKNYYIGKISDFIAKYKIILVRLTCYSAFGLIAFTVFNTYSGMRFLNFAAVLSDPRVAFLNKVPENILSSFYSLIFGLTPLAVVSFIFALIIILKGKKDSFSRKKNISFVITFYFIFFILIYYVASSILGVGSTVRYQISLYPIASIIAAIGLTYAIKFEKIKTYFAAGRFYALIFLLIVFLISSLYLIKPFYLEYGSFFLPKKYALNLDNAGDGSWEISQYLNNLPQAKNLYIWTDVRQVCERFAGRCAFGLKGWSASAENFDYFVIPVIEENNNALYKNNLNELKIGSSVLNFSDLYSPDSNYAYKFVIDGREPTTVKVVKNNNMSKQL